MASRITYQVIITEKISHLGKAFATDMVLRKVTIRAIDIVKTISTEKVEIMSTTALRPSPGFHILTSHTCPLITILRVIPSRVMTPSTQHPMIQSTNKTEDAGSMKSSRESKESNKESDSSSGSSDAKKQPLMTSGSWMR